MELPASLKTKVFEPKGLYYFSSEQLNTTEPHYFIIVDIQEVILHLVVCTSQFEKKKRYIETTNMDPCTLVWVKPAPENKLKKDSFVDCNNVFSNYTLQAFEDKLNSGKLEFRGHISDSEYFQIMNGIIASDNVARSIIKIIKNTLENFNK